MSLGFGAPGLANSLASHYGVTRLGLPIGSDHQFDHVGGMDEGFSGASRQTSSFG
jgi:hypothetical protein